MRTTFAFFALATGLAQAAAGAGFSGHSGGANFALADGSVRFIHYGLQPGTVTVKLEEHAGGLRGTIEQGGRSVQQGRQVTLVQDMAPGADAPDCLAGWPQAWNGGRATVRDRGEQAGELRLRHPREARCALVVELAVVVHAGRPVAGTAPTVAPTPSSLGLRDRPDPIPGGKHQPGHPDQGLQPDPLPDLKIKAVTAAPTDPTLLVAVIENDGPGASGITQLKLTTAGPGGAPAVVQVGVAALAPKQTAPVRIRCPSPCAAANLRVDDPALVDETDEGNNEFKYTAQ